MSNTIQYKLNGPLAKPLEKNNPNDSGYDVWLVKLHKQIGQHTFIFDTQLSVKPPDGFYFELVARSSIVKTGYSLANSVGIIDSGYRGNILVALVKHDDSTPHFELPIKMAQLIPKKIHHFEMDSTTEFETTIRGLDGGICRD
jgi:dUTP pyrophosphatase